MRDEWLKLFLSSVEEIDCNWSEADFAAMFRHQLDAGFMHVCQPESISGFTATQAAAQNMQTVRQVLNEPANVEQLILLKNYCKRMCDISSRFPKPIGTAVYYLAVGVAQVRFGERITRLEESEVRSGLSWVREQAWADDRSQRLVDRLLSEMQ